MNKPKVYIINDGGHDYSKAAEFGELTFLSRGLIHRFHITNMARQFKEAFKSSSPDDYLVVCGPSTMLCLATAVFAHMHGRLNLLIWQSDDELGGLYVCRKTIL